MAGLVLNNISKQFKDSDRLVVKNVDLQVNEDEFLVLLGPSGCGKTTILRMIAGLVQPTEGRIYIDDVDVTDLEPQERGIGMVFQNYAIYPHFTVKKNLTWGLEVARVKRKQREEVTNRVGDILDIRKHFKKKPEELSGGERQRVAMGRAMVNDCKLYLFDEALSNLDDNLRTKLRPEILKQFHDLKVPFVYVTHDQVDAMTMATKIAVMKDGVIQQLGKPLEIYEKPANIFVAGFLGEPKMNFTKMDVVEEGGNLLLVCGDFMLELPEYREVLRQYIGKQVVMGIRPEDILTVRIREYMEKAVCVMERYEHLGKKVQLCIDFFGKSFWMTAPVTVRAKIGEKLTVYIDKNKVHLFDAETELRL